MIAALRKACQRYLDVSGHMLGIFLCGFLYFPSSNTHNSFYYLFVLLPLLPVALRESVSLARRSWLARLVVLYLAYMTATALWNPAFGPDEVLRSVKHGLFIALFISLTSFLIERQRTQLEGWLTASPVILAAGALLQILLWLGDGEPRLTRMFGWGRIDYPLSLACIANFAIIVALGYYQSAGRALRGAYIASIIVMTILILATQSLFGLVILVLVFSRYLPLRRFQSIAVFAVLLLPLLVTLALYPRFLLDIITESGGWVRLYIWQHVLSLSRESWLFGHGLKAAFDYSHYYPQGDFSVSFNRVHNVYLACLYYGGVPGLLLSLAVSAAGLAVLFRQGLRGGDYTPAFLMLLGAIAIAADWSHIIDHPNLLYMLYWLPLVVAIRQTRRAVEPSP